MAEVKKIPTDFFDDTRVEIIESEPDGDSMIRLWMHIFLKSKERTESGNYLYRVAKVELTDNVFQILFRYKGKSLREALSTLEKYGMIIRNSRSIEVIPFWIEHRDRNSASYRDWRSAVMERDNYECQKCGSKKDLQAHHIISWASTKDNTKLRYDVNNGITLCRKCHLEAHGGCWRNV